VPSYHDILHADLTPLETAVGQWKQLPGKFHGIGQSFDTTVVKGFQAANMQGHTAEAALRKMADAKKQIHAAGDEASDVHKMLDSALEQFRAAQKTLRAVKSEIEEQNKGVFVLDAQGNVRADPSSGAITGGAGPFLGEAMAAYQKRIDDAVESATEADDALSYALTIDVNGSKDRGFNSDAYSSVDEALTARRKALADAQKVLDLAKKGHDMSNTELAELNKLMRAHMEDPVFGQKLATTWGAKGTLNFWAEMADPYQSYCDGERAELLADLQRSLGTSLASATHYQSPEMDTWKKEMVDLGDERLGTDNAGNPYGFQVMSNLMRYGNYDSTFLNTYGNALIAMDKKYNDSPIPPWINNFDSSDLNYGDPNDRGRDPMNGFLQALGHNPEASADFFKYQGHDPGHGDHLSDNFKYLTQERKWYPDPVLGADGADYHKVEGYTYLGRALESAATGHAYDAYDAGTPANLLGDTRTADSANVMKEIVGTYGSDPALMHKQPGIDDNLGRIGAAYIDELDRGVEDYGDASRNATVQDPSVFRGRFKDQLFDHTDAIKFLSTLGQSESAHKVMSAAQQEYTVSALNAHAPVPGSHGHLDFTDAQTIARVGAETHSILDHSRVAQIQQDYASSDEEQKKHLGKMTDWIKYGTETVVGGGVAVLTDGVGSVAVPIVADAAGSAVDTFLGQHTDDIMEKYEQDSRDSVGAATDKALSAGQEISDSPAVGYWSDPRWSPEQRSRLHEMFDQAVQGGRQNVTDDPVNIPYKAG
jgi:hypothetical protein